MNEQYFYIPPVVNYSMNHLLSLEDYPLNIAFVSIKRNWEITPSCLLFRDIDAVYTHLVRLPIKCSRDNAITSLLVPDFLRSGHLTPYYGLILKALFRYFSIDHKHATYLNYGHNAELVEDLSMPFVYKAMPKFFGSHVKQNFNELGYENKFSIQSLSHKKTPFVPLALVPMADRDINLYRTFLRQQWLLYTRYLHREELFMIPLTGPRTSPEFLDDGIYEMETKFQAEPYLPPLDYEQELDRFSSDFTVMQAMYNTDVIIYSDVDSFKPNHFFEYEYLVEGEDTFEQGFGEYSLAPAGVLYILVTWSFLPSLSYMLIFIFFFKDSIVF